MKGWHSLGVLGWAWLGGLALHQVGEVVVQAAQSPTYGSYLTDADGKSLYLFTNDSKNTSNCYEQCAKIWPPLLVQSKPTPGKGVVASLLGVSQRKDGTLQATYNGWPLYYYVKDIKPGNTNGQGVGGVWFLVSPQGEAIKAAISHLPAAQPPGAAQPTPVDALLNKLKDEGEIIYKRNCVSCHGQQGQGGVGAQLMNNPRLEDVRYIIEALTKGVGYMPAVGANFSNAELAAVATFIRNSFGNTYGVITEEDVAKFRR